MCGFTGYINKYKEVDKDILHRMGTLITHRGPDDDGMITFHLGQDNFENAGVVFRRLSIRDLSENGHQPMSSPDGKVTIAFNGEIYNADEIKPQLIQAGYSFKSLADTEVLLYAYLHYGLDKMLSLLDGMYAICLIDRRINCIYLVRDRLGEKPLYVYEGDECFLFGSEYKTFYAHPSFKAVLDDNTVDEYFLFRYTSDGDTLLRGVKNIKPGTYLKYSPSGITKTVYWTLPSSEPNRLSKEENIERYLEIFDKGLKRRLISDVPIGIQLSGGVDSSFMTSRIAKMIDEPIHTFSITFSDKRYSEEDYIDIVNKKYGCIPHKYEWNPEIFFNTWRESTWFFEQPMNHEGTLGLMFLNRESKKHVSVMLCGESADETLGGYPRFPLISERLHHPLKDLMIRGARSAYSILKFRKMPPPEISIFKSLIDSQIGATQFVPDKMFYLLRPRERNGKKAVYEKRRTIFREMSPGSGIHKYMNYEMQTYLQDLLMRADKVSMASSIECRVPYLMPELVEYACSLPEDLLVTPSSRDFSHHGKLLLKELCCQEFGRGFVYRPKVGFSMPLLQLMKAPVVAQFIEDALLPGIKSRGVVDYSNTKNLWDRRNLPISEKDGTMWGLWVSLSFELWAQVYLDKGPQNSNNINIL